MPPFQSLKLKNLLIGGFPASADKQNAAYIPQKQFRYSLSYSNVRLQAGRLDDQPPSLCDKCHLKRRRYYGSFVVCGHLLIVPILAKTVNEYLEICFELAIFTFTKTANIGNNSKWR